MGPCFRRDDGENVLATAGTRVIAIFSILERRCRPQLHRRPGERRDPYAVALVLEDDVQRLSHNNDGLWLWVPAFRGDDGENAVAAAGIAYPSPRLP